MKKLFFVPSALMVMALVTGCPPCMDYIPENPFSIVPVTDVSLCLKDSTTRAPGSIFTMNYSVFPTDATNKAVTWESSDESVATVSNGTVTVTGAGGTRCTITVTTVDGGETAVCKVFVAEELSTDAPGWGASLGTVSFASDKTWTVGNQIWSDVVISSACNKESYNGGESPNFLADGRNNPGYPGTLFSWAAVVRYQDQLCPCPWRVPTYQDFIDLDISLGGNGINRSGQTAFINSTYYDPSVWGGDLVKYCIGNGLVLSMFDIAFYWSQTDGKIYWGNCFQFTADGWVQMHLYYQKYYGITLRCVK
ncbi:MAG: Ig-like domain-containing protein [Prevotellaceae bacterium]|jgi:uncharacterized protein (TIGR02145 family)|nr:Ig-like domain-containing protein [Prevotellaceae bacterium]